MNFLPCLGPGDKVDPGQSLFRSLRVIGEKAQDINNNGYGRNVMEHVIGMGWKIPKNSDMLSSGSRGTWG